MTATIPRRESFILRDIRELLAFHNIAHWRINQQGVPLHDGTNRFRPSPTRGISDIIGILPPHGNHPSGQFLAIEVKRPGEKPTPLQEEFLENVNKAGGLAFVACSAQEVEQRLHWLL